MKIRSGKVFLVMAIILLQLCVGCASTPITIQGIDKKAPPNENAYIGFGSNIHAVRIDGNTVKIPKSRIISILPGDHVISCDYSQTDSTDYKGREGTTTTYTTSSFGFDTTSNFKAGNYYSIYVLRGREEGKPLEYRTFLSLVGQSSHDENYSKVVIRRNRSFIGSGLSAHIMIDGIYWVDLQIGKEAEIYLPLGGHKITTTKGVVLIVDYNHIKEKK
jgi:hypothetical protein